MFESFLDTPWKVANEFDRLTCYFPNRILAKISGVRWSRNWHLYGIPLWQIHRGSTVTIGENLTLRSTARSNPLGALRPCIVCTWTRESILHIGDEFGMTGGSIICAESVTIGNRVWIGANSIVMDTDFHPIDPEQRRQNSRLGKTAPIIIENDVFIGAHALILKGVRLGEGCAIGAGSVVTRDVPPRMVAAGNPARVIRPVTLS